MKFLNSLFGKSQRNPIEEGNPLLAVAIHELALNETLLNRERVYKELLRSTLLVPVPEIPPGLGPGVQSIAADIQIQLSTALDRNQHRVVPAFTDVEALRNWDPNTPYLGVKAPELFRFVIGTNIQQIVINPFDPVRKMIRPGGEITRSEFELLSRGVVPECAARKNAQVKAKPGQQVVIGIPAEDLRDDVKVGLRILAASIPEIEELYLFQMATQNGKEWSTHEVIGIQFDGYPTDRRANEIVEQVGNGIQAKLEKSESLDFVALSGDFGAKVRSDTTLIFKRAEMLK
jgi:hypothetical protein